MARITTSYKVAALAAAALIPLAACSSSTDSAAGSSSKAADTSTAPDTSAAAPDTSAASADAPFGAGCASVPATGAGSFDGMSTAPVATAASANPVLSSLVSLVGAANLVDTLNNAKDITVFAPSNDAIAKLDAATVAAVQADPTGLLTKVLTYHVIGQRLSPDKLAGTFDTLNGAKLTIAGSGEDFTVGDGGAKVVCGNVQTANATVYIIDSVLMPPAA